VQQELGSGFATTIGYVGSQGRNLFLRSVANNIVDVATNPNPANAAFVIREFSIVTRDANGNVTGVQNPYAEVDFKTSGGKDSYNAMMLSLNRRSTNGIATNLQYTFSTSRGTSGGSNEANTAANNARTLDQFDYEDGYNNFDVRHTFNISALYSLPFGRGRKYGHNANALSQALLGGWELGGIFNARSGIPINVLVTRNDILYRDSATGLFYSGPAAGRAAVINTPRGGQSRNVRRPDLVPGVNPFITDGGLIYLNPAAFAAPLPGTFGNMERNAVHGPTFDQIDFFFAKQFHTGARSNVEFRLEIFNMFDTANFANPSGTLNAAIPATPGQTNTIQPGEAYTAAAAGPAFGRMTSTVGRTVGLGTPRQVQLALRFQF
jgi:hypothetical protein